MSDLAKPGGEAPLLHFATSIADAVSAEPVGLLPEETGVPLYGACESDMVRQTSLRFFEELFARSVELRAAGREERLIVPGELHEDLLLSTFETASAMKAITKAAGIPDAERLERLYRLFPETRRMPFDKVPVYVGSLASSLQIQLAA